MGMKLELLEGIVKEYGAPLYAKVQEVGTVDPGEYSLADDGNSIIIQNGDKFMHIKIRTSRKAEGINPEVDTLSVAIFEAQRDADGEFDGKPWSVAKGKKDAFAY